MEFSDILNQNNKDANRFVKDDSFAKSKKLIDKPRKIDHKHDKEHFSIDYNKCKIIFIFTVIMVIIVTLMFNLGIKDNSFAIANQNSQHQKEVEKRDMDKFLYNFNILNDMDEK
jgi:hypothetical protein